MMKLLVFIILLSLLILVNGQSRKTSTKNRGAIGSQSGSRYVNGGLDMASSILDAIRTGLSSNGRMTSSDAVGRAKKRIDAASKAGR